MTQIQTKRKPNLNKVFHMVYESICIDPYSEIFGMRYRGKHSADNLENKEVYFGSYYSLMQKSYRATRKRFGTDIAKMLYKRAILGIFKTEQEAYKYEREIVNNDWLAQKDVLNREIGGMGQKLEKNHPRFGVPNTDIHNQRIGEAQRGGLHHSAIPVEIEGVRYEAGVCAGEVYNIDKKTVMNRCRSDKPKWIRWKIIGKNDKVN